MPDIQAEPLLLFTAALPYPALHEGRTVLAEPSRFAVHGCICFPGHVKFDHQW